MLWLWKTKPGGMGKKGWDGWEGGSVTNYYKICLEGNVPLRPLASEIDHGAWKSLNVLNKRG